MPKGGEACLRQAKRLPVRCTCLPLRVATGRRRQAAGRGDFARLTA